jgi:sialate O-acetylesterase
MSGEEMEKIRYYNLLWIILLFLTGVSIVLSCKAPGLPAENIVLPVIFNNNMVLQHGVPLTVWGKADSGGVVFVEFAGQRKSSVTGQQNKWHVKLSSLKAGGPHTMKIYGADTTVFENVLVGEVWLCSGQSNMEWSVRNSKDAQREMNEANYPEIRMFTVQKEVSNKPKDNCVGEWKVCSPEYPDWYDS